MNTNMRELLHSMPAGEQATLPQERLRALRLASFSEHRREMPVPAELTKWETMMQTFYPGGVAVWGIAMPWLEALLVVRYGEDTRHWPAEFSAGDLDRAQDWVKLKHPFGITYPASRGETLLSYGLLLLGGLGFLLAASQWDMSWLFLLPLFGTAATDYLENKQADHLFRTASFTKPTVLAVGLFTAAPGETGGGTEVTGGSYARVSNNPLDTNWNATQGGTTGVSSGTGGLVSNVGVLTFPTPTANWGLVTHQALFDAASAGNMLIYGTLTQSKTINNGDPAPTFPATTLSITFA